MLQARSIQIDNGKVQVLKIKLIKKLVSDDKKKLTEKNDFQYLRKIWQTLWF